MYVLKILVATAVFSAIAAPWSIGMAFIFKHWLGL